MLVIKPRQPSEKYRISSPGLKHFNSPSFLSNARGDSAHFNYTSLLALCNPFFLAANFIFIQIDTIKC
jgi:hypothetical protein